MRGEDATECFRMIQSERADLNLGKGFQLVRTRCAGGVLAKSDGVLSDAVSVVAGSVCRPAVD